MLWSQDDANLKKRSCLPYHDMRKPYLLTDIQHWEDSSVSGAWHFLCKDWRRVSLKLVVFQKAWGLSEPLVASQVVQIYAAGRHNRYDGIQEVNCQLAALRLASASLCFKVHALWCQQASFSSPIASNFVTALSKIEFFDSRCFTRSPSSWIKYPCKAASPSFSLPHRSEDSCSVSLPWPWIAMT